MRLGRAKLSIPLLVTLVGAVAVLAYVLTLKHASFRADDYNSISMVATPEGVMWSRVLSYFFSLSPPEVWSSQSWYRPLHFFYVALTYEVWGTNPLGYALNNVLLHAASAALVALIALELGAWRWVGLLAGLLFALYPTHPFSMNYVMDVIDVLTTALYVLALFAYLRFAGGRGRGYLLLSLGAFFLALLTKESAVSLPVVVLIYELYRRVSWRRLMLHVGAFGAVTVVYFVLRYLYMGQLVGGYTGMPSDPTAILPTFMRYLGLMLAPYNPNLLNRDYSLVYLLTLLAMCGLIFSLASRTNLRVLAFFLAAFLATFLPYIPLFMGWLNGYPGYGRFEQNQHVYLPSVFFCVGLALLVSSVDRRAIKLSVAVALVAFYAVVQSVNNQPWLVASDLVRSAQRNPEHLPVSGYKGAFVFPYARFPSGEWGYMGYDHATNSWFREVPRAASDDWRDWRVAQGFVVALDKTSGKLRLETEQGAEEIFTFDRKDLQIRIVGNKGKLRQVKAGNAAYIRFTDRNGQKIARSVEVLPSSEGRLKPRSGRDG
jgi:hypothetical protein